MRRLLVLLALASFLASPAGAGQDDARRAVRSGEARPLSEILSGLSGRYPGRVLDADIAERGGGEWTYGIRLLDPRGRVVELDVDARSGRVLRERGGRDDQGDRGVRVDRGDRGDRGDRSERGMRSDGPPPLGFAPQGGMSRPGFRDQGDDRRRSDRRREEYRRDRDDPVRGSRSERPRAMEGDRRREEPRREESRRDESRREDRRRDDGDRARSRGMRDDDRSGRRGADRDRGDGGRDRDRDRERGRGRD